MQKTKKILLLLGVLLLVVLIGSASFVMFGSYSEGYRVGIIAKMAKKGFVFKTWEGELTQGFLDNSASADAGSAGGVATRIWYFTAEDNPEVLGGIDRAIEQNHRVKLYYHEKFVTMPWVGVTRNIVYKVEEVQ
jgi:hypothetical protein